MGLLLLISFGPWAFQKLTRFVKSQIDSAFPGNKVAVHYHPLAASEMEVVEVEKQPPNRSVKLNFTTLVRSENRRR